MEIQKIKVSELPDFLKSDIYKKSYNIAITPFRAISQFKNPRANPDDIALIIAVEQDEIIGFIGALPDQIPDLPDLKFAWSSCWWVDPIKGKKATFPLLAALFQAWDFNILFRDLTPQTKKIILNLGKFEILSPLRGKRFFIRLDSKNILPKKKKIFTYLIPFLYLLDFIFNFFWISYTKIKLFLNRKPKYEIIKLDKIDLESENFIQKMNKSELIKRNTTLLTWILNHPWVKTESNKNSKRYPFSAYSKSFNNHFLKIYSASKMIGFLWITEHNGLIQLPYVYFEKKDIDIIGDAIIRFLVSNHGISLSTFNQDIIQYLEKNSIFWHQKEINQEFVGTKEMKDALPMDYVLQDGDGDRVFT